MKKFFCGNWENDFLCLFRLYRGIGWEFIVIVVKKGLMYKVLMFELELWI